jgi:hypothetical protein
MFRDNASSNIVLGSDDLELLQRFLEAWCEENGVGPDSEQAQAIAAGLVNWYQFELGDRNLIKSEPPQYLPESSELKRLMRQLAAA